MSALLKWCTGACAVALVVAVFATTDGSGRAEGVHSSPPRAESPQNYGQYPEVRLFVEAMHEKHGFDKKLLMAEFARIKKLDSVLRHMDRPAEKTMTWTQYRRALLDRRRVVSGIDFARTHGAALARAEDEYQVPAEVVLAILGIETRYGTVQGKYVVFHSLTTLAFDYPRRADFFRKELEELLLLTREEMFDLRHLTGSYAGAMGYGQFLPSSYRHYAVDYDGDGRRNLFSDPVDAIGSIANYLRKNGWQAGGPVAMPADIAENPRLEVVNQGTKPKYTLPELSAMGFVPTSPGQLENHKALVLSFDRSTGREYWLAFDNFRSIMSYNPRYFYAMAVHQLSQEIAAQTVGTGL